MWRVRHLEKKSEKKRCTETEMVTMVQPDSICEPAFVGVCNNRSSPHQQVLHIPPGQLRPCFEHQSKHPGSNRCGCRRARVRVCAQVVNVGCADCPPSACFGCTRECGTRAFMQCVARGGGGGKGEDARRVAGIQPQTARMPPSTPITKWKENTSKNVNNRLPELYVHASAAAHGSE